MNGMSKADLGREGRCCEGDLVAYFFLALIVLLSYGYEIFNFNLTIDEELHALRAGRLHMDWISQGRWGMALLNYFVLQNPIGPAVSVSIGLAGTVAGLSIYFRNLYALDRLGLLVVVGLAISVPTLAFTYTFSTLAYGIGFAFLAIAIGNLLVQKRVWWSLWAACLLAAFAISVYQTFVFVLAMLALADTVNVWGKKAADRVAVCKKLGIYVVGSVAIYLLINYLVLAATSQDVRYIGQFVDLKGFFEHPLVRSLASYERVLGIFRLRSGLFGEHSNWLGLVLLGAIFLSLVYPLLKSQYGLLLRSSAVWLALLALMVLADAITPGGAPIRSVIYIPVGIAIIVATAYTLAGQVGKRLLLSLSILAIIGNSMVNNHLHASSAAAEFRDRMLAEAVVDAARQLSAKSGSAVSSFKVEVVGSHAWPTTAVLSKTETFGASFFEWDAGNRIRVAAYLNLNGFPAAGASDEDRQRVYQLGRKMPAWPNDGWIALDGDVLVLKFGEYSLTQRSSLCRHGVAELCS